MRTKTFFWPSSKNPLVELEITRNGLVVSGLEYRPALDEWMDCTAIVKDSVVWAKRAQEFSSCALWGDCGDVEYEKWRDTQVTEFGKKIGLKSI